MSTIPQSPTFPEGFDANAYLADLRLKQAAKSEKAEKTTAQAMLNAKAAAILGDSPLDLCAILPDRTAKPHGWASGTIGYKASIQVTLPNGLKATVNVDVFVNGSKMTPAIVSDNMVETIA